MNTRFIVSTALALTTLSGAAIGQLSYAGGTYGNTFDTLASAPATGNAWLNDNNMPGWFLFRQNGTGAPVAITTYNAGTGSSNSGAFYSFGTTTTDRAFGGLGSAGAYYTTPASPPNPAIPPGNPGVAGWIAFAVTNNTGGTLTDFGVSFDGEQWRDGGSTTAVNAQTMVLEYGFGASFDTVSTWIAPGGNFDWSSPVFTNTGGGVAVDGNVAGLVAGRGGTISNLTWNIGDTLWVRWIEFNNSGNDHGLAIDRFGFSATPTPGAAALLGLGGLALGRRRR